MSKTPHNQLVAYFGYPDSDGIGSSSSRRAIVIEGDVNSRIIKGIETSDQNKLKSYVVSEMRSLRFVLEPSETLITKILIISESGNSTATVVLLGVSDE